MCVRGTTLRYLSWCLRFTFDKHQQTARICWLQAFQVNMRHSPSNLAKKSTRMCEHIHDCKLTHAYACKCFVGSELCRRFYHCMHTYTPLPLLVCSFVCLSVCCMLDRLRLPFPYRCIYLRGCMSMGCSTHIFIYTSNCLHSHIHLKICVYVCECCV